MNEKFLLKYKTINNETYEVNNPFKYIYQKLVNIATS